MLLSPMFIFVLMLSVGMFFAGIIMIEIEQREPRVGYNYVLYYYNYMPNMGLNLATIVVVVVRKF